MVTNGLAREIRTWFTMTVITVMLLGGGPAPAGIRPDREEVAGYACDPPDPPVADWLRSLSRAQTSPSRPGQ